MYHQLLVLCVVLVISQVKAQNLQLNTSPIDGKDGFSKLNETIVEGIQEIVQLVQNTCPTDQQITEKTDRILENLSTVRQQIQSDVNQQFNSFRNQIRREINNYLNPPLGTQLNNPGRSCKEIKRTVPSSPSGYYWIQPQKQGSHGPVLMYCDMTRRCNGVGGGWMRVTKFDVSNTDQSCPSGLRLLTNTRRRCAKYGDSGGCGSTTFSLHGIGYQKVCGKIIGYQDKSTDAFVQYHSNHGLTLDSTYVDGVSLTYGLNPRQHIWTFASAYGEAQGYKQGYYACPCSYRFISGYSDIPPFVGNDYFCDSGNNGAYVHRMSPNPLWDGAGCSSVSSCCSLNNPPWFTKTLSSVTKQDIEMRLCRDQSIGDEDIGVENVELYVQ